jgi:hypothetical protein
VAVVVPEEECAGFPPETEVENMAKILQRLICDGE